MYAVDSAVSGAFSAIFVLDALPITKRSRAKTCRALVFRKIWLLRSVGRDGSRNHGLFPILSFMVKLGSLLLL